MPNLVQFRFENGVQVYTVDHAVQDWIADYLECPQCAHRWPAAAPRGFMGVECPQCGYANPLAVWSGDDAEDMREADNAQ